MTAPAAPSASALPRRSRDPLVQLDLAQTRAAAVVAAVGPDDWGRPTPCSEWDVRDIVNKMVASTWTFTAFARRERPDPPWDLVHPVEVLGDDPLGVYLAAAADCRGAWRQAGALEGTAPSTVGEFPAKAVVNARIFDTTILSWDVAVATGQPVPIDDVQAAYVLRVAESLVPTVRAVNPARYRDPAVLPDDRPVVARMIAATGRDPGVAAADGLSGAARRAATVSRTRGRRRRQQGGTMDTWITDTGAWERFPYFTRANADEVGPEPFSPLGWSLAWVQGTGPGAADGYVDFGVFRPEEMEPRMSVFANYGGYFYNALSTARILGVRMPGASPEAVDRAYFGDHPGVPPYEPDRRDEDPERSEALAKRVEWLFRTESFPELDDGVALSRRVRAARPDLGRLGEAELVAYARRVIPSIREVWKPYCMALLGISIASGTVAGIVEGLGRTDALITIFAGIGGVESAGGSFGVWRLSRQVRRSPPLTAAFNAGAAQLLDRIDALAADGSAEGSADAAELRRDLDELLAEHGHRGPHEWDLRSECWATDPSLVLGMIDHVRAQDDGHDPVALAARSAEERVRVGAVLAEQIAGDATAQGTLLAALRASALLFRLRESGKSAIIRLYLEVKLAVRELGRRAAERGAIDDADHVFFLLDAELDAFVVDPASFAGTLRRRVADFAVLGQLEPPYIVDSRVGPPPIGDWPRRGGAEAPSVAGAGDVLRGGPASPGRAAGRARIIEDPGSADFDAGDVLVCRTTDPSWVPLFLAASAVVCNVGAFASHAAIVARELGVPCAVSVVDATRRIPEGATVEVDGGAGTVTILSVA